MAKIDVSKFLGKPKEYDVLGEKVMLEPLKGKDLDIFTSMKDGQEADGAKRLVMASLDLSREDVDALPVSFLNAVIECILDVNGLKPKE